MDRFDAKELKKSNRSKVADKAKGTLEAFGAAEVLASGIETLNPVDGDGDPIHGADWHFSDFSSDEMINTALQEVCKSIGLQSSQCNLIQTTATVISHAAVSEILQHAFSIGGGFTKIDFTGNYVLKE